MSSANSRWDKPAVRRSSRRAFTALTMPFGAVPVKRSSAFVADDHGIQLSYSIRRAISKTTETLGKVNVRFLGRTR